MPRASWTGTIRIGLVEIPVRLVRATVPDDRRFHLLHRSDGGRIHHKRVCALDGREVPYKEIVRGFEVAKDEYLAVMPEELAWLENHSPRTIVIEDFVEEGEVEPVLFERTYYVVPEEPGRRAYQVLLTAIERNARFAVGRLTMRLREHLCSLYAYRGGLAVSLLRYATEIVPPPRERRDNQPGAVDRRELQLAKQLIDAMSTRFQHQHYKDEYRDRMVDLLRRKAHGGVSKLEPKRPPPFQDLAEALSASLNATLPPVSRQGESARTEVPTAH